MTFPADFVWGTATAAYQIEGAATADGRGESIWDRFCATPGKVRNGESGAIACDFYGRYRDDVALLHALGADAFRFSIAWPRVLPEGRGRVNEAGLDFYDRLVDALLEAGIRPWVTLYHWDLPQALEDAGGWPERATAEAFVEYVDVVARRLGDRVAAWVTHNEPFCASWLGYGYGMHAPGRTSRRDAVAAAHHLLLSHGWAVDVLRRESAAPAGITLDLSPVHPLGPDDEAAADALDGSHNRFFLDAVLRGSYPDDVLARLEPHLAPVAAGDLRTIAAPLDFLGVNTYSRLLVRAAPAGGEPVVVRAPHGALTDMGWEIYPDALYEILKRVADDYAAPALYVTENGAAFGDVRSHDGHVHDLERIAYLDDHVAAVGRALAAGVPVRGYFVWSLLDNFEWAHGYSRRFGLVFVDYPTLARVPKQSFYWYRDFISAQRSAASAAA